MGNSFSHPPSKHSTPVVCYTRLRAPPLEDEGDPGAGLVAQHAHRIPEEERERVLERFVRLENERNSPGNGLGLSLVKAVTRVHRAKLWLGDNNPGLVAELRFTRKKPVETEAT